MAISTSVWRRRRRRRSRRKRRRRRPAWTSLVITMPPAMLVSSGCFFNNLGGITFQAVDVDQGGWSRKLTTMVDQKNKLFYCI
jgi:hypothetical protein